MIPYFITTLSIVYFMEGCGESKPYNRDELATEFINFYDSLIHTNKPTFLNDINDNLLKEYKISKKINHTNIKKKETVKEIIDEIIKLDHSNLKQIEIKYYEILKKY